jgi:hypothetical protein
VEKSGRTGRVTDVNIIRRMRYACRITKTRIDTHTLIIFNGYCFSTTIVTRTHLNVTLYVHSLLVMYVTVSNSKCYFRSNDRSSFSKGLHAFIRRNIIFLRNN